MNKKAFTLIELLVVISIMILLTSGGVMYFDDYVNDLKFEGKIVTINDKLAALDKQIKNKKLYDYELKLNTNQLYFYVYKNNIDNVATQFLDIDNTAGIMTVKTDGLAGMLWQTKIYSDYKYLYGNMKDSSDSFTGSFDKFNEYNIVGYMSGTKINDINIKYYSETNLDKNLNSLFYLSEINSKEDKTGTSYNQITVQNILGKKLFYSGSINDGNIINTNELFLFIENNGKEDFIKIIK